MSPSAKYRAVVVMLLVLVVLLASALVKAENQRYAQRRPLHRQSYLRADSACLAKTESRTGWYWHIYYALTN